MRRAHVHKEAQCDHLNRRCVVIPRLICFRVFLHDSVHGMCRFVVSEHERQICQHANAGDDVGRCVLELPRLNSFGLSSRRMHTNCNPRRNWLAPPRGARANQTLGFFHQLRRVFFNPFFSFSITAFSCETNCSRAGNRLWRGQNHSVSTCTFMRVATSTRRRSNIARYQPALSKLHGKRAQLAHILFR